MFLNLISNNFFPNFLKQFAAERTIKDDYSLSSAGLVFLNYSGISFIQWQIVSTKEGEKKVLQKAYPSVNHQQWRKNKNLEEKT